MRVAVERTHVQVADTSWFPHLYDHIMALGEATVLAPHRRYLTNGITGRVLDVGAGTGANLPYFASAARGARETRARSDAPAGPDERKVDTGDVPLDVHLVEPDHQMRARAREAARSYGHATGTDRTESPARGAMAVSVVGADAEALPYRTDSVDVVISSLVGCTIPDLDAALDEIARVLRPGGEFRFLEHVAADGLPGRLQSAVDPVWTRLAAGCHLDRDLEGAYRAHEGLDVRSVESFRGIPPAAPFVRGVAVATGSEG